MQIISVRTLPFKISLVSIIASLFMMNCEDSESTKSLNEKSEVFALKMPVPSALSSDPDDPDWVFEGYAEPLSKEEKDRRKRENDYIRTLTDEEYKTYKKERKKQRKEKKRKEAKEKGISFDDRDDLYVALLPNNQVWRRKKPDTKNLSASGKTKKDPANGVEIREADVPLDILAWNEAEESSLKWDEDGPGVRVTPTESFCPFTDCSSSGYESDGRSMNQEQKLSELRTTNIRPDFNNTKETRSVAEIKSIGDSPKIIGQLDKQQEIKSPSDTSLRAVFGTDSRSLISKHRGYNLTSYPWRTHGMLTDRNQSDSSLPIDLDCSGTKIAARVVATAGHCLYDGGWTTNADRWYPGPDGIDASMNGRDPTPNGYKTWVAHLVHPDWYDDGDYKDDMGWYVLQNNQNSCNLGWLGFADESNLNNDTVNIYGAPGEWQDCAASPRSDDACYGSLYGTSGKVTRARVSSIRYKIDTQPGQSGSGVYKYYSSSGNRYVVAVHSGKWSSGDENYACRMNSGKFDMTDGVVDDYPSSYCN